MVTKIKTPPLGSSIQLFAELKSKPGLIVSVFAHMHMPGGEEQGAQGPTGWGWVGIAQRALRSDSRQDKGEQSKML